VLRAAAGVSAAARGLRGDPSTDGIPDLTAAGVEPGVGLLGGLLRAPGEGLLTAA
jgi:hypothetical protein